MYPHWLLWEGHKKGTRVLALMLKYVKPICCTAVQIKAINTIQREKTEHMCVPPPPPFTYNSLKTKGMFICTI